MTFPVFLTRGAAISAWTIICCSLLVVLEKKNLLVSLEVCKILLVLGGSLLSIEKKNNQILNLIVDNFTAGLCNLQPDILANKKPLKQMSTVFRSITVSRFKI